MKEKKRKIKQTKFSILLYHIPVILLTELNKIK